MCSDSDILLQKMRVTTFVWLHLIVWLHLCEMSRTGKSTETESRLGLLGSEEWGGVVGIWGVAANGYRVSLRWDENVLELDSGCTILRIYEKNSWIVHFFKRVNFMVGELYCNKTII